MGNPPHKGDWTATYGWNICFLGSIYFSKKVDPNFSNSIYKVGIGESLEGYICMSLELVWYIVGIFVSVGLNHLVN